MPKFMDSISRFHPIACEISNDKRQLYIWQHTTGKQVPALILPRIQIVQFLSRYLLKITSRLIRQILKHLSDGGDQLLRVCGDCRRMAEIDVSCFYVRYYRRNILSDILAKLCYLPYSVIPPSLNAVAKIYVAVIAKTVGKLTAGFFRLRNT